MSESGTDATGGQMGPAGRPASSGNGDGRADVDGPGAKGREATALIAGLAECQHGVVSRRDLLERGLSGELIKSRRRAGVLVGMHPGVYCVGHRKVSRIGEVLGAVLASGPHAYASHLTAAELWGLRAARHVIDITRPYGNRRQRGRIRVHRTRCLLPPDVSTCQSIPSTSVPRTLVDISANLDTRQIERAVTAADREGLLDWAELDLLLARFPSRVGMKKLRDVVGRADPLATEAASVNEELFLSLWNARPRPEPAINCEIEGHIVDFAWPPAMVVVECDGYAYHSDRLSFEADRLRDLDLRAAGYEVFRATYRMLSDTPGKLIDAVHRSVVARMPTDSRAS